MATSALRERTIVIRPLPPLPPYDMVMPPAVHFGAGRFRELGTITAGLGQRAWIVGGTRSLVRSGLLLRLEPLLSAAGVTAELGATTAGEPTVEQVARALAQLPSGSRAGIVVLGIGGGAAIDLAKAVAALATNVPPHETDLEAAVIDRLEGVGRGLPISRPPLPVIAVPTTAGTGAEATRNAVISCPRRRFKKSMRSPLMVPRVAVVDPDLCGTCSRETTAASGLDCITQLIESYVCRVARPLPRALVLDALPRAVAAFPRVLAAPDDADARAAMSHAALVSGIALTNAGLGLAHGVAAALGIECGTPHGLACAACLPLAIRVNLPVAAAEYAALERAVSGDASAEAASGFLVRIEGLCRTAGVPLRLRDLGLARDRVAWLAENSGGASMRGNPRELDAAALRTILEAAW
jgi:alcohol dehydrogenase class IV